MCQMSAYHLFLFVLTSFFLNLLQLTRVHGTRHNISTITAMFACQSFNLRLHIIPHLNRLSVSPHSLFTVMSYSLSILLESICYGISHEHLHIVQVHIRNYSEALQRTAFLYLLDVNMLLNILSQPSSSVPYLL